MTWSGSFLRSITSWWTTSLGLLAAIKKISGGRITTVSVNQGHYASEPGILDRYPAADLHLNHIGDLLHHNRAGFLKRTDGRQQG